MSAPRNPPQTSLPGEGRSGRRGKQPQPRCPRCALHVRLCLCKELEPLDLETWVVVLSHQKEVNRTSNTGRLVPLTLTRGEVRIRGAKGYPLDTTGLVDSARLSLYLYPTPESLTLSRELVEADGRPVTLLVPDGNWGQARRMGSREADLAEVQRVHLPPGPPSRYRLRFHPDPKRVSTFEAVARALGIIEGPQVQAHLERIFDIMVERTLWLRGKLPAEQVTGGIPPNAS